MIKHWVIPDVHGYAKTLKALIEEQIRPTRNDCLYFLGDYIDRGPDPKGVIDYIIHLQEEEYSLRLLRGNHEDYLLRIYNNEKIPRKFLGIPFGDNLRKEWFKYGGKTTMKSFQTGTVQEIPDKYINWFKQLEYYIILDGYVLVHAGLNFSAEDPFKDIHSMMWIKDFNTDPWKIGNRKVVHGHVPVSLEFINLIKSSDNFHFIDLDNGVYLDGKEGFGNLVALELHSLELVIQNNLD
jgi:serine/threonine protein phosphatase 1